MSDLIRREDAYAAIRGLTRHIDRIAAISALPAVQPDAKPGKEVMPDVSNDPTHQSDTAPAGLSAGGGDSYENEAAERSVWNILTNPSLTLDPDQRREDRDERAMLAREDDQ